MRVLVTARSFAAYDKKPIKVLEDYGLEAVPSPIKGPLKEENFLELLAENEFVAFLVGGDQVTAKVLKAANGLKVVSMHGAGLDRIDTQKAKELGIKVYNAAGLNAHAVAELTIAFIFALSRKLIVAHNSVLEGAWLRFLSNSIQGKTLALIGLGSIGISVAKMANALGMKVIAYDLMWPIGVEFVEKKELIDCFKAADFLSLHAPLNNSTRKMVNKESLALMKESAYIINTSRGELIDEDELSQCLEAKKIAGAAFDVFAQEPPENSPLLRHQNCIFTPHMGGRTFEAVKEVSLKAAQNVIEGLQSQGESAF